MTLVAFHVTADRADVITDTLSYGLAHVPLGRTTKATALPHLDTVVMGRGNGTMWVEVNDWIRRCTEVDGFDYLASVAPQSMRLLWGRVTGRDAHAHEDDSGATFLAGYSQRAGRFRAVQLSSRNDFTPMDVSDALICHPAPDEFHDPPTSDEDWARLAVDVQEDRALAHYGDPERQERRGCMIGGEVIRTTLERGASSQRTIHRFPTSGDDFLRLLAATPHPLGQLTPCMCGSGVAQDRCHGLQLDALCPCGSGQRFGDCHRVDLRTVDRNEECPCESGRKFKRCCLLHMPACA